MAFIRRRDDKNQAYLPDVGQTWDPFRVMRDMLGWDPLQGMERALPGTTGRTFSPEFEVKETPEAYIFRADIPGVKEDEVEISLVGNRLTVSGRREEEDRKEGETYFTYERMYGSFSRSFTLPEGIDPDKAKAEVKNGVLTLWLSKKPEVKARKITVGAGGERKQIKA